MKNRTIGLPPIFTTVRSLLFFSCIVFAAGCSHVYTPKPSVRMEPIKEFTGTGDIALKNDQSSTDRVVIMKNMGHTWFTDLHACTDVVIERTKTELEKRGMHVAGDATKTLSISVVSISTQVGAIKIETQLVMRVATGSGYTTKYVAQNNSEMMAMIPRQCDGAIMRGVNQMLNDPKIVEYLTK